MRHQDLDSETTGKLWNYDCLMICSLLGLSLSNREMAKLCIKYGLLSPEDAKDATLAFYTLHHACHIQEDKVPRALGRSFSLSYAPFRKALEGYDESAPLNMGNILNSPHPKALGGALWSTLNDPRKTVQAQGIYGAHKIMLQALRKYQKDILEEQSSRKTVCPGNKGAAKTSSQEELHRLRQEHANLREALEREQTRRRELETTSQREKEDLAASKDKIISRLRKRVRMLEYSPRPGIPAPAPSNRKVQTPLPAEEKSVPSCFREKSIPWACPHGTPGNCPFCMLSDSTISVIGGLSRLEPQYREVVEKLGARCRYHCGHCHNGGKQLRELIRTSDRVVFITSINSHNALQVTRETCKKESKPLYFLRQTSPSALERAIIQDRPDIGEPAAQEAR